MRKFIVPLACMIVAGSASAVSPFLEGDSELYLNFDDGGSIATAVQPGIGDGYGGDAFGNSDADLLGESQRRGAVPEGYGEAYGSPLLKTESGELGW